MNDDLQELSFPQRNDVVVTAVFTNVTDGTGATSEFYRKPDRATPDTDPSAIRYTASITQVNNQWQAQFTVPAADNAVPGVSWWHVDAIDSSGHRKTAAAGPLVVGAV